MNELMNEWINEWIPCNSEQKTFIRIILNEHWIMISIVKIRKIIHKNHLIHRLFKITKYIGVVAEKQDDFTFPLFEWTHGIYWMVYLKVYIE